MLVLGLIVQLLPLVIPPQRPKPQPVLVLLVFAIRFVAAGGILYPDPAGRTQAAAYGLTYSFSFIAFLSIVGTATSNTASTALLLQLGALFFGGAVGRVADRPWSAFDQRHHRQLGGQHRPRHTLGGTATWGHHRLCGRVLLSLAALVFSAYYGIAFATWFFNTAISRLVTQLTAHSLSLVHSGAVIQQEAALRVQTSGTMQTLAEHVAAAATSN